LGSGRFGRGPDGPELEVAKPAQFSGHGVWTISASQMVTGAVWIVTAFPHFRPVAAACTAAPVDHDLSTGLVRRILLLRSLERVETSHRVRGVFSRVSS
jgi:hypothetical protein